MRLLRIITGILVVMIICQDSSAQIRSRYNRRFRTREVGFSIGATNFLGELGGANNIGSAAYSLRDFDFPAVRPTIGGHASYQILNWAGLKTSLTVGYIRGNDKFTDYKFRLQRKIDFRTIIVEFSEQFELYLTKGKQTKTFYNLRSHRKGFSLKNLPFTTYLFVGIGVFYFDPEGKDREGKWVRLRDYHTEGQGEVPTRPSYSQIQVCIPMGIGVKYPIGKGYSIGIEYGLRKTFTDYIDDASMTYFDFNYLQKKYGAESVSLAQPNTDPTMQGILIPGQQRGDPRDNDSYMFALITLYYDISKISRIRNFRF